VIEKNDAYSKGTYALLKNIIKKNLLERANLGHGSQVTVIGRLYRETDTVLKKLLILIKY
jgi:hypothetical protein